jgi:phenylpyruvate tautomerase PptA (4-oxalocrotonate tautomerase family)
MELVLEYIVKKYKAEKWHIQGVRYCKSGRSNIVESSMERLHKDIIREIREVIVEVLEKPSRLNTGGFPRKSIVSTGFFLRSASARIINIHAIPR